MRRLLLSRRRVAVAPPLTASEPPSESERSSVDQHSLERSGGRDHEISSGASW
jgi:hypothetical protein